MEEGGLNHIASRMKIIITFLSQFAEKENLKSHVRSSASNPEE